MTEQESVPTPEATEVQPTVSPELTAQINALKAITTTHKLIVDGRYPHTFLEDVRQSLQFLESLHVQALDQALSHPDAGKIPELAEVYSQRSATNGQK